MIIKGKFEAVDEDRNVLKEFIDYNKALVWSEHNQPYDLLFIEKARPEVIHNIPFTRKE